PTSNAIPSTPGWSAHRDLAPEAERRDQLPIVAAPEPARGVPAPGGGGRQQRHVLVGRGHQLGAVDRLAGRLAPQPPVEPLADQAKRGGERLAVEAVDHLHEPVLVVALDGPVQQPYPTP